jgi:dihydrofolate reductase
VVSTQYYTATSLDGYIADPDNSLSWLFQFGDVSGMEQEYPDFAAGVGALAMGSMTYEWIAAAEGFMEEPGRWPYEQPTWVFSSRDLPRPSGPDIRFVSGDVAPVHAEMVKAAGDRNVWIVGGGDLAGQFYDRGLLDEIIVTVAPVTLGAGAPLLPRRIITPPLRLVAARAYGDVFASLRYSVRR